MSAKQEANLRRLAVDALPEAGGRVVLSPNASRHTRVLRLHSGSQVELFDGAGRRAKARVVSISKKEVVCQVESAALDAPLNRRVVLVQALPKGATIESIIRTCTELGVYAIHLAFSERSIPRPSAERVAERGQRLARLAKEASALACRALAPVIAPPAPLIDVAERAPTSARRVVFWEGSTQGLDSALLDAQRPFLSVIEEIWAVVGPEGGISEAEIAALRDRGYRDATLGPLVLRVETAAPLAVGLIQYRLGWLASR
jgi:16S rRNA (uracil1498-N3)-methyltransferase